MQKNFSFRPCHVCFMQAHKVLAETEDDMALGRQVIETAAALEAAAPIACEWARIPRTGQTLEGLYRSQIFALVKSGAVKSAAIKAPGAARAGMRLVHVPSLRAYIGRHVEGAAALEVAT
jgi:hypothetical protein